MALLIGFVFDLCFDLFEQRFRFGERCRIIGSVPGLFQDLQDMHFFLVGQVDLDFICVFIVISPCYFYNVTIFIIAPKERILNTISQTTDKYDRFSRMLRLAPRRRHGVLPFEKREKDSRQAWSGLPQVRRLPRGPKAL